jgi:hypothetical protein
LRGLSTSCAILPANSSSSADRCPSADACRVADSRSISSERTVAAHREDGDPRREQGESHRERIEAEGDARSLGPGPLDRETELLPVARVEIDELLECVVESLGFANLVAFRILGARRIGGGDVPLHRRDRAVEIGQLVGESRSPLLPSLPHSIGLSGLEATEARARRTKKPTD